MSNTPLIWASFASQRASHLLQEPPIIKLAMKQKNSAMTICFFSNNDKIQLKLISKQWT
jgi:hypothetical protein